MKGNEERKLEEIVEDVVTARKMDRKQDRRFPQRSGSK
jgi:hypothetical protein